MGLALVAKEGRPFPGDNYAKVLGRSGEGCVL